MLHEHPYKKAHSEGVSMTLPYSLHTPRMRRFYRKIASGGVGMVLEIPKDGERVLCPAGHEFSMVYQASIYGRDPGWFFDDLRDSCPGCLLSSRKEKKYRKAYEYFRGNYKRGRLRG